MAQHRPGFQGTHLDMRQASLGQRSKSGSVLLDPGRLGDDMQPYGAGKYMHSDVAVVITIIIIPPLVIFSNPTVCLPSMLTECQGS